MITVEEKLLDQLEASETLVAMVGGRIYPGEMPQHSPMPTIVYQRIGGAPLHGLRGFVRLESATIQITTWAESYGSAKTVAMAVRDALRPYPEDVPIAERDLTDPDGIHKGVGQDFSIWHVEQM
jgi:Protein of unknown function (DUF3168)